MSTPMAKDLENNYMWLLPVCRLFPDTSPAVYFLVDSIDALDFLLDRKLLLQKAVENDHDTVDVHKDLQVFKANKAVDEAGKLSKLFGYLRHLFRNTESASSPKIHELKTCLKKSVLAFALMFCFPLFEGILSPLRMVREVLERLPYLRPDEPLKP